MIFFDKIIFSIFVIESRSLYLCKKLNEVKKRTSLVSKLLPIKRNILVICLFSAKKKNNCVLPSEMLALYLFHTHPQFPLGKNSFFDYSKSEAIDCRVIF